MFLFTAEEHKELDIPAVELEFFAAEEITEEEEEEFAVDELAIEELAPTEDEASKLIAPGESTKSLVGGPC